ncbi:DUF6252 family protein [Algibacter sp. 2305UL17-15]|uniref:DUF6252 family protein n=1 Tax=Algibacter sp. 2305UL17-15 TaxID=3231268 RepID=UPI003458B741
MSLRTEGGFLNTINTGYEWNSINQSLGDFLLGQYQFVDGSEEVITDTDYGDGSIYVKITSIDKVNKTISLEFNFTSFDNGNNKIYSITDGVFKDVVYSTSF